MNYLCVSARLINGFGFILLENRSSFFYKLPSIVMKTDADSWIRHHNWKCVGIFYNIQHFYLSFESDPNDEQCKMKENGETKAGAENFVMN